MEFTLKHLDGIFEVTTSGDANLQGYVDIVKAIAEHEEWKPGGLVLFNNTKLNTGPLTMDDVKAIAGVSRQYMEQTGTAKLAIVVGRPLDYGMTQMWEYLVKMNFDWEASEKSFWNRKDAIAWLKNESSANLSGLRPKMDAFAPGEMIEAIF